MDRQDAKPRRPSLMAGTPRPGTADPSPARILSDMDGGKPASAAVSSFPIRKPLILAAAVAGLIAMVWWSQSGSHRTGSPLASVAGTAGTASAHVAPDAGSGAATIIDEPSSLRDSAAFAPGAQGSSEGSGEDDPLASPFTTPGKAIAAAATPRADGSNPFTPSPAAGKRSAAASASAGAARSGNAKARGSAGEPDLMATLLGNIKTQDAAPASGLDSLIRKMESDDAALVASNQSASTRGQPTRSQQIQSNLRECPPANTAKGLKCRQEICKVYAGRDPACPAD